MPQKTISINYELNISKLAISRDGKSISKPVSFIVLAGSILCLKGINGSGKSTLMRLIAGFLPIVSGTISIDGKPYLPQQANCKLPIKYLSNSSGIHPELTALQNIIHLRNLHGISIKTDYLEKDFFQISEFIHQPVKYLSAGQRQRLALTALLDPTDLSALWLLDEAETGLDPDSQKQLQTLITAFSSGGGRVILASHNPVFQKLASQHLSLLSFQEGGL